MTEIPERLAAAGISPVETPTAEPEHGSPEWWDQFERTVSKADWFTDDGGPDDNPIYITVQEHYVGRNPNLKTLRYMLCVNDEEGEFSAERKVTGRELVRLGQRMMSAGLEILGLG